MTGAWKGGLALANATSIGATTSGNSTGTALVGSASTFTKGAWAQLIASTTTDINWVSVAGESMTTGGSAFAVDIGVGASGSELVVAANLNYTQAGGVSFFFPLCIQAGSRIAARFASNNANDTFRLLMQGFQDTYQSAGTGSTIDTLGYNTALNVGTAVDPGASTNTKGAYSQIALTTTADYAGFFVTIDAQNTTGTVGTAQWLVDIAVGASGSEIVILPNVYTIGVTNGLSVLYVPAQNYYPIQIATGSRIAARAQCTTATSPDRLLGVTFYGVRQ